MTTYNPFEILGLSESSNEEEIKKRFRQLLFKYHPDIKNSHKNVKKTKVIINAFKDALIRVKSDKFKKEQKKVFKLNIFIQPNTEDDFYKIVYQLLINIENYYYSDKDTIENIINFLNSIDNSKIMSNDLYNMLSSLNLFFSERQDNILTNRFYNYEIEKYKLIFFNYIKNIFDKKDYISYRMAINLNSNLLIKESVEFINNEKNKDIIDEIVAMLIILLSLLEENIYDKLFEFIKK